MVTFTCNDCGTSLRKNAVEKHGFKCRISSLSCIDCNKDFSRQEYNNHNQCITENQKYGGKDYVEKPNCDKGKKKQDQWLTNIENYVASGAAGNMTYHLNAIIGYPNVPRRYKKFENFARNCLKINHPDQVQQLWNAIETANKAAPVEVATNGGSISSQQSTGNDHDGDDRHVAAAVESVENKADSDVRDKKKKKKKDRRDKINKNASNESGQNGVNQEESEETPKEVDDVSEAVDESMVTEQVAEVVPKKKKKKDKKRKLEKDENEAIESKREKKESEDEADEPPKDEAEEPAKVDEAEDEPNDAEKDNLPPNVTKEEVNALTEQLASESNQIKEKRFKYKKEMMLLVKSDGKKNEIWLDELKQKIYKKIKKEFKGKKEPKEEVSKKVDKILSGSKRFTLDHGIVKLKHTLL